MQIASLGKARRQGGSSITFVQVRPEFCISGLEYRYLISGIGTQFQHWNMGIGTARGVSVPPLKFTQVSIPGEGYRYPFDDPPGIDTWGGVSVPKFLNGT
ncbi:hypothetical protein GQ457_09G022330 [Hibiscus cannabinus]